MEPPTNPIFAFTDDLAGFHSIDEAVGYHEYREAISAFDQNGNVVQISHRVGFTPRFQEITAKN